MKFILPSNKTSKIALSFLVLGVFAIIVIFEGLCAETYNMPLYTVNHARTQPSAFGEVLGAYVEGRILAVAREQDFKWPGYLVRLARCESGLNPDALGDGEYRSRGLFQISAYFHPGVTDDCAFNVECSTRWTIDKINAGQQGLWTCDRLI